MLHNRGNFFSHFARPYGGNQIKTGCNAMAGHHTSVRGGLSLTKIESVRRSQMPTVARMPQGKAKTTFPHELRHPQLPLDYRFGMLQPGVKVVAKAVTMR